jgi:hypothetical protein
MKAELGIQRILNTYCYETAMFTYWRVSFLDSYNNEKIVYHKKTIKLRMGNSVHS